jgi:ketosteroid isomerase-like protein
LPYRATQHRVERIASSPLIVVQEAFELWNRHDWDAFTRYIHPAIRAVDRQPPIDQRETIDSRAAYMKATLDLVEMFDDARMEFESVTEEGDHVICDVFYCGIGPSSGVPTRQHQIDVYRVADGVIVEAECGFRTIGEARDELEALAPNTD